MLVNWTPEAMKFFRQTLVRKPRSICICCKRPSASKALDDVARGIGQLLYRTANGNEPKPHERREIELGDYYQRELLIYTSPAISPFLARLRGIDAFWRRWKPPARKAKALIGEKPEVPAPVYSTRHEAERSAMFAVQQGRDAWSPPDARDLDHAGGSYDPIAEARGFTPEYFRHLLDSSLRTIDVLPMRFPFSRALAMQLRAIRRATDRRRMPTAEEQRAIGMRLCAAGPGSSRRSKARRTMRC